MYSRLLKRQIKNHLEEGVVEKIRPFLDKVNDSYQHFDTNVKMMSRSMEMSTLELSDANIKLQEHLDFLEQFNYGATHDLKNHALNMRSMIMMLKKRASDQVSEKESKIIDYLDQSSAQFIETVKSFLLAAKMEMRKDQDVVPADFDTIKAEVLNECNAMKEERKGSVIWKVDPEIKELPHQLTKMTLTNLVYNGLKYSKADVKPEVVVSISQEAKNNIKITVQDNGRGMDLEKNRDKLFQIFSRLSNSENEEGTGMGLYLVKKMIERNNGTIEVDSTPNVGTIFEINFNNKNQ